MNELLIPAVFTILVVAVLVVVLHEPKNDRRIGDMPKRDKKK